ncbi:MAG TPA: hypothetical protein VMG12_02945 [Polyangiaceae bacterium]|nr:hypothetical protein [Polyangiaceae bacterium]
MKSRGWRRAWLGVALGCGSPSYDVPRYPHPEGAPAEPVSFPPPPAQIEQREEKPPARGCLWADGQWVWAAQRWDWRPGGWVRPPEGCRYSPPTVQWAPGGEQGILYYRPGRWYAVSEPKICADAVSCISLPNPDSDSTGAPPRS